MTSSEGGARTIGQRVAETGGRTTGFDYLRIGLALAVMVWHSFPISYGKPFETMVLGGWARPTVAFILPAFFALSGFLVAGSLERNTSLLRFAALRAIRIMPALGVEVLLSALILGPLLTTVGLAAYLSDGEFHEYFLNVFGIIHFDLPGLFETNPIPRIVNGQLWTIPYELECYAALAALAALGLVRRPVLMLAAVTGLQLAVMAITYQPIVFGSPLPELGGVFSGRLLVMSFLWGVVLYRLRDRVPFSGWLAAIAAAVSVALMLVPLGDALAALPIAYAVAYLGLQQPRSTPIVALGDFSYGIFLYGFAVQQTVASLGAWTHHWYLNLALAVPLVTLFAAFSWYGVEKPALALRTRLSVLDPIDRWIGSIRTRLLAVLPWPASPSAAASKAELR